jgi:hypothetical protein
MTVHCGHRQDLSAEGHAERPKIGALVAAFTTAGGAEQVADPTSVQPA